MTVASTSNLATSHVLETSVRISRWVVVAGLVAAGVIALLPSSVAGPTVVVLSALGLVVGLPHGSIDHLIAARLTGRSIVPVAVVYGATAVLTWLLLVSTGPVALVVVLALSAAHFGAGELELSRATTGWRPRPAVALAAGVAGTGALLLPLARAGDLITDVASGVSPQLGAAIELDAVRLTLAGAWVLAATVTIVAAARAGHRGVVLDVVLVGALGALAPPLLAFALWFGGWHGLRHCARLLTVDAATSQLLARGRTGAAVKTLAREAALPTLAATTVLAALVAFTVTAPDATAALSTTLVVLLALTVPHMLVVGWLDLRARRGAGHHQPGAVTH